MANINQVITQGIGTPSSIPYFLNMGLGIGAAAAVVSFIESDTVSLMAVTDTQTQMADYDTETLRPVRDTTAV